MSGDPTQILILGRGFAGVYTARYLEKLLRPEEASITLINRENYWVYQPMLPEIISGSLIHVLEEADVEGNPELRRQL